MNAAGLLFLKQQNDERERLQPSAPLAQVRPDPAFRLRPDDSGAQAKIQSAITIQQNWNAAGNSVAEGMNALGKAWDQHRRARRLRDASPSDRKDAGLGVALSEVTPEIASSLKMDRPHGLLVGEVIPHTPGADIGLARGDVILEYTGRPIGTAADLQSAFAGSIGGFQEMMMVWRDNQEIGLSVSSWRM